ncbi:MAG: tetratricopeptide repeat protein [Phycisphaerae bacterium]
MKRAVLIIAVVACLAGCQQQNKSISEAKVDARARWQSARARVLYGVASEHLKVGQLNEARQKSTEALALDPELVEARLLLGKVLIEQGKYSHAIEELRLVVEAQPAFAHAHYLLGVALEKGRELDLALQSYRKAYTLDTTNISPIIAATEVMVAQGRLDRALDYIESYMGEAGSEPAVFELAGRICAMQKDHTEAAKYYEVACDLDYKNVRYREALGQEQFLAGRHVAASETLRTLLQNEDYEAPVWVRTMLGDCYMVMGWSRKARDVYYEITKERSMDAGAWANHAKASLACNDTGRAILSAKKALDITPGRLDATLVLGYALMQENRHADAVDVLNRATAAHPSNDTILCLLGRAHEGTGNNAEATRCYVRALRINPDNPVAKQLLKVTRDNEVSSAGE